MEIPQITHSDEYQHLEQVATWFGVQHLAPVITRRRRETDGPFTILFAGPEGAGKSAVLSVASSSEIPEGIVLAEAPSDLTSDELDARIWLADAVVWVVPFHLVTGMATGNIPDVLKQRFAHDMPVLVVVTHMDNLSPAERNDFIQDAREESLAPFDRIVPFALQYDARGKLSEKVAAPIRVEVRTRLFRNARCRRDLRHEAFLRAMRDALTHHFEQQIDTILNDRATCLDFDRMMQRRLDKIFNLAAQRVTEIVPPEAEYIGLAEGTRLQRTYRSFARALVAQIQDLAAAAPAFLREMDAGFTRASDTQETDLPLFPQKELAACFSESDAAPAAEVIRLVSEWLGRTRNVIEESLRALLEDGFAARHGFGLDEVLLALEQIEAAFMDLRGGSLSVPTPFSAVEQIAPAEFLLLMQDASFVERWNRAVAHQVARSMTPRMRRRIAAQIDQARDLLLREWDQNRGVLEERVRESWQQMSRKQVSRKAISWPLAWTLEHLKGGLENPSRYISERRFSAPEPEGVSLLIEPDARNLLMPFRYAASGKQDAWFRIPMVRLAELLRMEALRLWEEDRSIKIDTTERTAVHRRVAAAAVLTAAAGGGWLLTFGTDTLSLSLLPFLIATQTGASWHWIDRFVSRSASTTPEEHAQVLHETVRRLLIDYTNRIQYRLDDLMQDETYLAETEQLMLPIRYPAAPHIPYGELIGRLQKNSACGVTNRKYVPKRCVQTATRDVEALLETKLLVNPS